MYVDKAEIFLEWSNEKKIKLGTLDITADDTAKSKVSARIRFLRQRIGWEMVRKGFWLMFPWQTWKMR